MEIWYNMEYTSARLTVRQAASLDQMVEKGIYPSVSEAIRAAVALLEDKHGIHGKPAGTTAAPAPVLVAS
jgi:Arc/MetJ-type ribon-helix-helix transcriptional regulator